jgi:valyl-tRNA synthetase
VEKTYNPSEIEAKYRQIWEDKNLFSSDNQTQKNQSQSQNNNTPYCIMLPPPNVTGSLHMGHAFQQTIMDILTRTKRMSGEKTLWQPGTDHAGIATQMVVERQLNAKGTSGKEIGRDEFIKKVWDWKGESGGTITSQMRRLGASVDWEKEKFTMDADMSKAVSKVFVDLYKKGLIYRGKRLVNWDPVLQTAVSDLEVSNADENGFMHNIKYPFVDGDGFLEIATTRPETMLADGALAVNPKDERYSDVIGKKVWVPLCDRQIPVVADDYVDPEFGTGCVKITPAHDFNDWEVGKRHDMEIINLFTPDAKMNENAPKSYAGMDRFVARKQVLKDLEEQGLLVDVKPRKLTPPRGDRSGAILEPYLTDQWFVKTDTLAKKAVEVVKNGDIRFVPQNWEKTYFNWLDNIEDWCISRQIWWGHRIPAYFDKDGNIFVANSLEEAQNQAGDGVELFQDDDVLDTWFSSALWPFSTLGWPEKTADLEKFYPTSVLVTGFDIIFFWVARMIMFGLEFTGKVPFKDVYITGLVRDGQGDKMSKSKGNVLDPIDIIDGISLEDLLEKRTSGMMQPQLAKKISKQTKKEFPDGIDSFGTDALRFNFAANASFGRDIKFDLKRVEGYRNFCNKIWNASRFVFANVENIKQAQDFKGDLSTIDKWIFSRLQQVKSSIKKHQDDYRLDLVAQELYEFVWHDYCDWYLELSKSSVENDNTKYTLITVLDEILKLLHPIIPFITEEIFATFKDEKTLMEQNYPQVNKDLINKDAESEVNWIKEFVLSVRKIRGEMNISPNKKLQVFVENPDENYLNNNSNMIISVAKLESIENLIDDNQEFASGIVGKMKVLIPLKGLIDKDAEIARLGKEIEKINQQIGICNNKLSNEKFVANAKPEVVQVERDRLSGFEEKLAGLESGLDKIKKL